MKKLMALITLYALILTNVVPALALGSSSSQAASTFTYYNAVRPVLECVERISSTSYVARFGYQNDNAATINISVGNNNKFSPSPQGRGQTTAFLPGRKVNAFQVPFNGSNLVWSIKGPDGQTRTATASSSSALCPAPTPTPTPTPSPSPSPSPSPTPTPVCAPGRFNFVGNSGNMGAYGNIRTFTATGGNQVKASAFSRVKSTGAWETSYLVSNVNGLGVSNRNETASNARPRVDNIGERVDYLLLEFSNPIIADKVRLQGIGNDKDASFWIGSAINPFSNHLALLTDSILTGFGQEDNDGTRVARVADINASSEVGNILVIAARPNGTNDEFKATFLDFLCQGGTVNTPPDAINDSATVLEDSGTNVVNVLANDTDANGNPLTITAVTQPANGEVSISGSTVTFKPIANFFGTTSFTYTISDGQGGTDTATVNVTVTGVNDAPIAVNNAFSTNEDTVLNVAAPGVLGNDLDADGNALTAALVSTTTNGTLALNANGSFSYTPNANFSGTDSFTYRANDGLVNSNVATVNITVTGANDAPDAVNDSATVAEDSSANAINVLVNDTDGDGNTLSVTAATNGANGSVTFTATGVTYSPNANFNGSDSFTYTISDGQGGTDTATVNVTVSGVNDAPDAVNDAATVAGNSSANAIAVLANDTDVDGDTLTITAATNGANGTVTFTATGVSYTPNNGFSGSDSFTYTISDGNGGTDTATVNVTVEPIANPAGQLLLNEIEIDPPSAISNSCQYAEIRGANAGGTVPANTYFLSVNSDGANFGFANQAINFGGQVVGSNGTITLYNNASSNCPNRVYGPGTTFVSYGSPLTIGTGSETYLVVSSTTTLFNGQDLDTNDDGILDPILGITVLDGTALVSNPEEEYVYGADAGVVNISNTISLDQPDAITRFIENTTPFVGSAFYYGELSETPDETNMYAAPKSANFPAGGQLTPGNQNTLGAVNAAPDAVNDSATVAEDSVGNAINVLANDTDAEGDSLTITSATNGTNGTVTFTATGVTYTPNANFVGSDSFTYTISDGNGGTDTATVSVTVGGVNDAPDAVNDSASVIEDSSANAINVLANDTDGDGDTLVVTAATNGANGTVTFTATGVSYTPNANFSGSDSFTYTISDGNGGTDTATVSVTVGGVNDAPDAVNDVATVAEDSSNNPINVLVNDTDVDGNTLSVTVVTQGANGTVTFTTTGVSYTPAANFVGSDSFTYTISDGNGGTDTATVAITVGGTNDAPVAVNDSASVVEDSSANAINVLVNDTDADGDTLSVTAVTQGANGSVAFTATGVSYTPNANFNGTDSFTYTISDGNGGTASATVNVTVTSVNDAPDAVNDSATVAEDSNANAINVLANDTDVDGNTLSVTAVTQGANGTVTFTATGVSYTPAANFSGSDSFTYTISDGNGGTDTATVSVTVTAVNDAPDAVNDVATVAGNSSANAINVLANDTDVEGNTLVVTAATNGTNGTVTFTATGVSYTPNASFSGTDSFTYTISDGNGGTDTATVNVTVEPVVNPAGQLLLNELEIDPPSTISNACQYAEIRGANAGGTVPANTYFLSVNSDGANFGFANQAINFGGQVVGANGTITLFNNASLACPTRTYGAGTTFFSYFSPLTIGTGSETYLVVSSTTTLFSGQDLDTDDDGILDANLGITVLDGAALIVNPEEEFVYGADAGVVNISNTISLDQPDAITRSSANSAAFDPNAFFFGELAASPDSTTTYAAPLSPNFPVGGVLTPGAPNVP